MADDLQVTRNEATGRFEVRLGADVAFAEYLLEPGVVVFPHTVVPEAFAGKGVGGKLASAALDWARAEGLKVVPLCSFIAGYIAKHPAYQDLVKEEFRARVGL